MASPYAADADRDLLDHPWANMADPRGGHSETFVCRYCFRHGDAPWAITHPWNCKIRFDPRYPPTREDYRDPEAVIQPLAHPPHGSSED